MKRIRASKEAARKLAGSLGDEERILVRLCRELYEDSWEDFMKDLDARLSGKPYVFKHTVKLQQHIGLIRRLIELEEESGVRLADHIDP